jgi:hypothetical protein
MKGYMIYFIIAILLLLFCIIALLAGDSRLAMVIGIVLIVFIITGEDAV